MENPEKENKGRDPVFLIQQIQSGIIEPEDLTIDERQECVEMLKLEGQSNASIARLLKCTLKTIQRDLKAIWKKNSEDSSAENALNMVSEFLAKARANHDSLVRLAGAKDEEHESKVNSARYAGEALREMVKMLQSLGYMPKEATKIQAEIHHQEDEKSPEQLRTELAEIEKIMALEGNNDPVILQRINSIKKKIILAEAYEEIKDIKGQITNNQDE